MRLRHTLLPVLTSLAVVAALATPASAAVHASGSASIKDSDHDGMPDRWEISHQLNPKKAADARKDPDGDGVTNLNEFRLSGDPRSADTDADGVDDGIEAKFHTKLNRSDSDGDGVKDGDEDANDDGICDRDQRDATGVIDSFDETTGDLVLTTKPGAERTVTLTDDTQIEQREHKGWAHFPGGELSRGPGHHHGDDADDPDSGDDSDDPGMSGDDWTEDDAGDPPSDINDDSDIDPDDADVVDPENADLLAEGTVVLKIKLAKDGTVAELKLA